MASASASFALRWLKFREQASRQASVGCAAIGSFKEAKYEADRAPTPLTLIDLDDLDDLVDLALEHYSRLDVERPNGCCR